jgi:hypothetical protein
VDGAHEIITIVPGILPTSLERIFEHAREFSGLSLTFFLNIKTHFYLFLFSFLLPVPFSFYQNYERTK